MKRFSVYCYDKFHYQDPLHSRGMERMSSCCCAVKRIEMNYAKEKAEKETEAERNSLSLS